MRGYWVLLDEISLLILIPVRLQGLMGLMMHSIDGLGRLLVVRL